MGSRESDRVGRQVNKKSSEKTYLLRKVIIKKFDKTFIGKVPILDQKEMILLILQPQGLYFEINTLLNAKNGWQYFI